MVTFISVVKSSAIVFKKWDYNGFYKPFAEQLRKAISEGHEVQLHLHPHWFSSLYENGRFYPSDDKILSSFRHKPYPGNIQGIIESGIKELNEICYSDNYKCIAYRGGGYHLTPDTDVILSNLYKNGIKYDSSIIKGFYSRNGILEVDYRRMPSKANWTISIDGPLNKPSNAGIEEIPIASIPINPWLRMQRIINKVKNKKFYDQMKYNNTGTVLRGEKSDLSSKIKSFVYAPLVLSFDHLHIEPSSLNNIIKYQLEIYEKENSITLCANSHPKSLGKYHLEKMSEFIGILTARYKDNINICGYGDLNV